MPLSEMPNDVPDTGGVTLPVETIRKSKKHLLKIALCYTQQTFLFILWNLSSKPGNFRLEFLRWSFKGLFTPVCLEHVNTENVSIFAKKSKFCFVKFTEE